MSNIPSWSAKCIFLQFRPSLSLCWARWCPSPWSPSSAPRCPSPGSWSHFLTDPDGKKKLSSSRKRRFFLKETVERVWIRHEITCCHRAHLGGKPDMNFKYSGQFLIFNRRKHNCATFRKMKKWHSRCEGYTRQCWQGSGWQRWTLRPSWRCLLETCSGNALRIIQKSALPRELSLATWSWKINVSKTCRPVEKKERHKVLYNF